MLVIISRKGFDNSSGGVSLNDICNWFKMFFYSGGQECQAINASNFGLNLDDISGFSRTEIFS